MIRNKTLAIDFDGVIHDHKHPIVGRRMGPPMPGAKDAIDKLSSKGNVIIVHTVRPADHVIDWLKYYDIRGIVWNSQGKPQADFYIDDKAIHHVDWPTTLSELNNRRSYEIRKPRARTST